MSPDTKFHSSKPAAAGLQAAGDIDRLQPGKQRRRLAYAGSATSLSACVGSRNCAFFFTIPVLFFTSYFPIAVLPYRLFICLTT